MLNANSNTVTHVNNIGMTASLKYISMATSEPDYSKNATSNQIPVAKNHNLGIIMVRGNTYFLISTVVTVNLTPFSHSTMKRL